MKTWVLHVQLSTFYVGIKIHKILKRPLQLAQCCSMFVEQDKTSHEQTWKYNSSPKQGTLSLVTSQSNWYFDTIWLGKAISTRLIKRALVLSRKTAKKEMNCIDSQVRKCYRDFSYWDSFAWWEQLCKSKYFSLMTADWWIYMLGLSLTIKFAGMITTCLAVL